MSFKSKKAIKIIVYCVPIILQILLVPFDSAKFATITLTKGFVSMLAPLYIIIISICRKDYLNKFILVYIFMCFSTAVINFIPYLTWAKGFTAKFFNPDAETLMVLSFFLKYGIYTILFSFVFGIIVKFFVFIRAKWTK